MGSSATFSGLMPCIQWERGVWDWALGTGVFMRYSPVTTENGISFNNRLSWWLLRLVAIRCQALRLS